MKYLLSFPHIFSMINRMVGCFEDSEMLLHVRLILYFLKLNLEFYQKSVEQIKNRKWSWEKEVLEE